MNVTVKLYGDLRDYATHTRPHRWEGEVPSRADVRAVIEQIGCPRKKVVRVLRDGLPVSLDTDVREGDLLFFLSRLGGG
jgi:molybdopterin converting factor small subunit